MDPRMDELINRFNTTIPWGPRMATFREAMHLVTDQVIIVGMAFTSDGNMISNRLQGVSQTAWNAEAWTI